MAIKTIGVVGAGTMGNGIAQVFAQAGFDVVLHDAVRAGARTGPEDDRGKSPEIRRKRKDHGRRSRGRSRPAPPDRLTRRPLATADYVVEAIVEDAGAKSALFTRLDALLQPHAILTSNTSSISITALGAATKRPDRVLGMHFMNPVPVMTLVELIRGQATSRRVDGRSLGALPVGWERPRWRRPTIQASSPIAC